MDNKYLSTELTTSQRELLARLAVPLKSRGISRAVFREILSEANFSVPKASLDRWVRSHLSRGNIFTTEKGSGPISLLDIEQREIAAGWVLSENESNHTVSLSSFSDFCSSAFGVHLGKTTAHDYLHDLGFSSKVSQVKTSGFSIDVETLSTMMVTWRRARKRAGDLKGLVASVDFTFTGHRNDRRVTFAPIGSAQPKSSVACSQFTNCIVTVVWSDGENRTPPALFTFNGKFRRDRVGRTAWASDRNALVAALTRYGIDTMRVVYVGADTNERRTYCSESADLLKKFFELYEIPPGTTVFSDNGNAFFPGGISALTPLGFARHVAYPSAVHQYLSPNDNRLHGTSKAAWRASRVDFKNDVESSLLLHYLDADLIHHQATWFERNIMTLTTKSARELIRGRSGECAQVDHDRLQAYRTFMGLNVEGGPGE